MPNNSTTELKPTLTIDQDGKLLTEEAYGISMPAQYTFECVNNYIHDRGRSFEELESLCLGLVTEFEKLKAQHQQAANTFKLVDGGSVWLPSGVLINHKDYKKLSQSLKDAS